MLRIDHVLITSLLMAFFLVQSAARSMGDLQQVVGLSNSALSSCSSLADLFPGQVLLPGDIAYEHAQSSYWAVQQSKLIPTCRFVPLSASHVQQALKLLITHNASFAVTSGGHSSNIGASNIEDGVTIDLSSLSEVTLTDDSSAAWLGPGARWREVYAALEPHSLIVSGGRVAHVGVGGYVLGGGFSWFASECGWTCDSVIEFEVVTPSGEIPSASTEQHADLFWALKGSLGAFGIVTRIKVPTIKNAAIYAGAISYPQTSVPQLLRALEVMAGDASNDLNTQGYLSFGWLERYRAFGITAYLLNTRGENASAAFSAFSNIPHIFNGMRRTSMLESAEEIDDSNLLGLRRSKFTLTTNCNAEVLQSLYDLLLQYVEATHFEPEAVLGATFQPLTVPHLQAQGNIFNLSPHDGPLLLVSVELWWKQTGNDDYHDKQVKAVHDGFMSRLDQLNALHPFVYPNYAATWQDPFQALSKAHKQQLEKVKQQYDPEDAWRWLVPGIWHV